MICREITNIKNNLPTEEEHMDSLYVVMPAYNEEANIEMVIKQWYPILKGKSVQEAHSLAVQTSAYVCTKKGAMPILPPELTA